MPASVDAATLKSWLADSGELALLDVREAGEFGEGHLFHAVPLPYSRFELEIERLVPRRGTRIVLCDDGLSGIATKAARRAEAAGYADVSVLKKGTAGWAAAGFNLFAGVNVPSKAFGELVEIACHTPRVSATELRAMRERGERLVIVDGRPLAEYRKMNIPGGICCPNGELALRIGRIAADPQTKIVVNCAGRTRSILGAQTLLNFGVPNPVYALENGTQGWFLAGLELEHGAARSYPDAPRGDELERLRAQARVLATRFSIKKISSKEIQGWRADPSRTTYLFDVRTPEEFAAGSLPGALHAPGGQLVQATDQWVGVRGARIVLADDDGVRAIVVASWLRQMGHDASVLEEGIAANLRFAQPVSQMHFPEIPDAEPSRLGDALVIDLRSSAAYREKHLRGSRWSIRPRLADALPKSVSDTDLCVIVADERAIAQAAALDLIELGVKDIRFLAADRMQALPLEASPDSPADSERIDFLFFTHGRHEGNRAAAEQYLAWETALVDQLDASERATFRLWDAV